jgi:hypothetical protein
MLLRRRDALRRGTDVASLVRVDVRRVQCCDEEWGKGQVNQHPPRP